MSAELDIEKAKRAAAEEAARQAMTKAATAQASREAAEHTAHEAVHNAALERASREAAEQSAQEAAIRLAAEQAKREAAEKAAQEAAGRAAHEKASREAAEQALHEASVRSASDRTERDAAVKNARDLASLAEAERVARAVAEQAAHEANAKASADRKARAERKAREAAEAQEGEGKTKAAAVSAPSGYAEKPGSAKPTPPASLSALPQAAATGNAPAPGAGPLNSLIPVAVLAVAGAMFCLISGWWTSFENTTRVKTDDAYIRTDVAPLSTKATGVVKLTAVNDFDKVKAGQVLVELKNDEYKARVDQAQDAIAQAEVKLSDMKQRKEQQDARVNQARSAIETSRAGVQQAEDAIAGAEASIEEARAGIDGAKASVLQSQAAGQAAAADLARAALERTRQEALLADESATKDHVEQVVDESERAVANLAAQKAAQSKAQAELLARKAQLIKATRQLSADRAERQKAILLVQNHNDELTMQEKQRELLDGEEKQLAAELLSKKAGLIAANVDLDYTVVRAPADGVIGELKVKPGQLVSAGTQVVTMISAKPWVIANYRETQLAKVKDGDPAAIEIDALPGTHLKGRVESIAPASGAQFSLLPPDNASGNFTKITQRIPVKISLDDDREKLASLRPGMSAIVTINPGGR